MTTCAVCPAEIHAITAMFVLTEFLPELGTIAIPHSLCSPECLGELADRFLLAVEGGATS